MNEYRTTVLHLTQLKSIVNQMRGRKATTLVESDDSDLLKMKTNYPAQAEYLRNKYDIIGADIVFYSDKSYKKEIARVSVNDTPSYLNKETYTPKIVSDSMVDRTPVKKTSYQSESGAVFVPEPANLENITVEPTENTPLSRHTKLVADLEYDIKNIKGTLSDKDYLKLRSRINKVREIIHSTGETGYKSTNDEYIDLDKRMNNLSSSFKKNYYRKTAPVVQKEKVDDDERKKTYRKNKAKQIENLFYLHTYGAFGNRKTKREIRHLIRFDDEDEVYYKVASFIPGSDVETWKLYTNKDKPKLITEAEYELGLKPLTGLSFKNDLEDYLNILNRYNL